MSIQIKDETLPPPMGHSVFSLILPPHIQAAAKFKRMERRFVYTTPKSFLELLKLYGVLLTKKREEADGAIDRLANGLQKLRETGEAVTKIEEDLKVGM